MQARINNTLIISTQKKAKETDTAIYIWDESLSGFGCRISPKGACSWLVQKWTGGRAGKAVRTVIGSTRHGMPLEEARKLATGQISEIHKGANPAEIKAQKRRKLAKDHQIPPLGKAWEEYWSSHQKGNRYWVEMNQSVLRCISEAGLDTHLQAVTKADIKTWLKNRGTLSAKRSLYAALNPFFKWCLEEDYLALSPMAQISRPKAVASRERELKDPEIHGFWSACRRLGYPFQHYFLLLLLLGQRRQEVAGLRSDEIDLDTGLWVIPGERTKNGKEHIVHLSPMVILIIKDALEKQAKLQEKLKVKHKGNFVWLLTTTCKGPIKGFSKAKRQLDAQMKELEVWKPFRVHDLRRTMVSKLAALKVNTDVADRLLNHVSGKSQSGVKGVYQKYDFLEERKAALLLWSDTVKAIAKGQDWKSLSDTGMAREGAGPIMESSDSEPISVAEAPEIPVKRTRARKSPRKVRRRQENEAIPAN